MKHGVEWTIKTGKEITRENYAFIKSCISDCAGRVIKTIPVVKERAYEIVFEVEPDMLQYTCYMMGELASEEMISIVHGYCFVESEG